MIAVLQAILVIGLNLVPAGGVVLRGWSPATALVLYWCENVVGSVLISLRIALHRRTTRQRGHYRGHYAVKDGATGRVRTRPSSFLAEFTTTSLAFCFVHGVFLAALLAIVVKEAPDRLLPPSKGPPAEAPRWFLWIARRLGQKKHGKTGQDVSIWWRETTRAERQRIEEDEQIV